MADEVRVTVLSAPEEPDLPGLDGLPSAACVTHVRDEAALAEALPRTDVLVVTDFRSDLLARVWASLGPAGPPVRWVHATSAGVDRLMFEALVDSDAVVTNARGVFDRGIAEYVLGAVLLFAKDSMGNLRHQSERRWVHRETELVRGKRALIIGAGSIGREVGRLLEAAGLEIRGTARSVRDDPVFGRTHAQTELDELLPEADLVVITAPLTEETEGLFDAGRFARMRPSARLINVGRGPIVKTDDLVEALAAGELAGAALDVFEEEPLPQDSPLWDMDEVMISAHMAGDFIGWREALGEQFVDLYRRWSEGETLPNTVDKRQGHVSYGS